MRTLLVVIALALATSASGKEAVLELGGLRQVRARIATDADTYEIQVRMRAVQCFDEATNTEVNRSLARSYALQALARHLGKKPPVTVTVTRARLVRSELEGKSFALTLRVPRAGVKIEELKETPAPEGNPEKGAERAVFATSLLERKGQYEQVIAQLEAASLTELKTLERAARGADADALAKQVRAVRKKLQGNLDRLAAEVRADPELLTVGSDLDPDSKSEKDQVLAAVAAARKRLLKRLEAVGKEIEK